MRLDDEIFSDWWHANHAWHTGDTAAAEHLYRRLRSEHAVELFYEVQLAVPTKFVHPLGAVLGRATYAPHLVVYQGVSIGSTVEHERPTFTGPCVLFPHSGVIGPVTVGKNVWITAGTIVEALPKRPFSIPDDSLVYRAAGDPNKDGLLPLGVGWKRTTRSVVATYFPQSRSQRTS